MFTFNIWVVNMNNLGGSHVLQHGHAVLLIKSSLNRIFAIVYYL